MKRLNVAVEDELHKMLKVAVAEQTTTIAQYVNEAIAEKIENDKKKQN